MLCTAQIPVSHVIVVPLLKWTNFTSPGLELATCRPTLVSGCFHTNSADEPSSPAGPPGPCLSLFVPVCPCLSPQARSHVHRPNPGLIRTETRDLLHQAGSLRLRPSADDLNVSPDVYIQPHAALPPFARLRMRTAYTPSRCVHVGRKLGDSGFGCSGRRLETHSEPKSFYTRRW